MEISSIKVRRCLENLKILKNDDSIISRFLSEKDYDAKKINEIFNYLSDEIINLSYTECIQLCFKEFLLLIVSCACKIDEDFNDENFISYRHKSYILSQLSRNSPDILRYALKYFKNRPPPFQQNLNQVYPKKKQKKSQTSTEITDLIVVKTCHNLLTCDPIFFKSQWDWSVFIENYWLKGCDLQKLYCNHIVACLMHMTESQLNELNNTISENIKIQFDNEINKDSYLQKKTIDVNDTISYDEKNDKKINLDFHSDIFVNIEDVLLPVYNSQNAKFYKETDGNYDRIVKVGSTKTNLRSIALGILSEKAVCLSGPVGCGKTTLVEYLARKTGRVCPKRSEIEKFGNENVIKSTVKEQNHVKNRTKGNKRKSELSNDSKLIEVSEKCNGKFEECNDDLSNEKNGFLRIQLGDQTDSKMILGQYRCTDVPGEFIWLPGVLTQAVMNGYWLLLEDLDCATQETCMILSNLLENKFLSVPGFRDHIKIEPEFQLFFTIRTNQSSNNSQKAGYSLLEKYLYTINIHQLFKSELCEIISLNYPKLSTIANRIVDVFLTFSTNSNNIHSKYNKNDENKRDYVSLPHENFSIVNLPNSGRMVSTRDLMKLCERSNPMFSVTSTECAYFVFQNAVDVFCSYLPQGKDKLKLIISIGAKLGIIQSRCEFYSNKYKPEIKMNDNNGYDDDNRIVKIGRITLNVRARNNDNDMEDDDNTYHTSKRIRLSDSVGGTSARKLKKNNSTFSFTRISSCLLEKIAVSIAQNEPILLVGETGVGKTSAVQYVAEKTNHKLVVVNMNNQSDISDLIGGFKPVDLCYIMAPIRYEFEYIFRKTYNEITNEVFLSKMSICYNQGNYSVVIKLMLHIVERFLKNIENKINTGSLTEKVYEKELCKRWKSLNIKLLKLDAQLKKSISISFAFIPGSLVNCIRNGDWVLLDEINLASAETLECLSTILEPDGSIVLLERGDLTPIKRHPDFRIFACMNPSTDIGKKDLPTGIRNRFTEFFVDELIAEIDLILLVSDYLSNTGIKRAKVLNVVKLYKNLKKLSQLELNDGLGNRPVFSLRTLCRALRICAKNLCGSIERNLYESFCLSFLTQLDPNSHKIVLNLIMNALLTDTKAILSQPIPKPGDNFINFEGYWIQKGPKEIQNCDYYILTESVKQNLKDLCRIISIGKLPILLQGPTSAGKTSLIEYVAKCSGNYCLRINNHEHTDLQEYIGTYTSDANGKLSFKEGVLVQAMRNGFWIILDELNLASTDILEALNRVLDDNRELFIPEIQTLVRAHQNFMLFATQNPPGLYGGRKTLSRAFKNRFIELHFNDIPKDELEIILEKRCFIPKSYAKKMVNCMSDLQMNRKTTTKNNFTLRDLFRWGNRYTFADKNLLENNSYDWNQHLVDEGYLVLSAKVRSEIELEIIEETLYKNFRKHITTLFELNENTSMVTKNILDLIYNYKCRSDIIWTQNMTRMAVLTAKALQFNEPALLVGPTGCGKTTICQILANINSKNLRILNCHMHTEGADFLGGLRPCRKNQINESSEMKTKLFEWVDGPLVLCMKEGNYFMADEISLAEDSVLERLNSVLEPEKTILLAEKSDISSNNIDANTLSKLTSEFIIKAQNGFQFLATMNPGGDFGKKELSPALRNRFTEIWCKPSDTSEDLIRIAENFLKIGFEKSQTEDEMHKIAIVLIDTVMYIKQNVEKFKYSVRDIQSWANYISITMKNYNMNLPELIILGLETLFLDSLQMIPNEAIENIEKLRQRIINFAILKIKVILKYDLTISEMESKRTIFLQKYPTIFNVLNNTGDHSVDFFFNIPTTKNNLFRLISAMNLNKAILLEGPPGVGKTSIIENLCKIIGYKIVRINLCEHTDLADLFGTDLPAEEKLLEIASMNDIDNEDVKNSDKKMNLGKFVWRDGPLLSALKSNNTWILLDELNLAPQNVLEGLNAILDHRGEVYIPELNKKFVLNKNVRIFGCQNPLKQGGGRKGLPQSFLNRFIKVYLKKLKTEDLLLVIKRKYSIFFQKIQNYFAEYFKYITHSSLNSINLFNFINEKDNLKEIKINESNEMNSVQLNFDLAERMVKFSEILDKGITNLEFGYKGGPFEINLRDLLRWCNLLIDSNTGFIINKKNSFKGTTELNYLADGSIEKAYNEFLQVLYERMKLVYYQRMRSENDKIFIRNTFSEVFNCNSDKLNEISEDISLYWTDEKLYLNDISIDRELILKDSEENIYEFPIKKCASALMLQSQRELLKNMIECLYMKIPIILCGPTDSGKTKIVDTLCTIINQIYETDTIDDSVTGGFQQIDLNRHLEEASNAIESIFIIVIQKLLIQHKQQRSKKELNVIINLFSSWKSYLDLIKTTYDSTNLTAMSDELILFKKRIHSLCKIIDKLLSIDECEPYKQYLSNIQSFVINLRIIVKNSETLNTGGHFEWCNSKFVQCLKFGKYICLEHVNFCSSAIVDRLNSVFEPNGYLLISEKGVVQQKNNNNENCNEDDRFEESAEIIFKHKNFRAFLTIDPKNGELSRAMRNRCIEISLSNDNYTTDDLKMIIYENGIHEWYLMNTILKIHENIRKLSDFSPFTISNLTHFTSLVASYRRIGFNNYNAIYNSAVEVYVNSSYIDLLGYGLEFYHTKLMDIIKEEIDSNLKIAHNKQNLNVNNNEMKNLIIKSGNLDMLTMIKLQTTPLCIILRNVASDDDEKIITTKKELDDLYSNFKNIKNFEIDLKLMRFLIYILYELSTLKDITLRNKYLNEYISNVLLNRKEIVKELLHLSDLFMKIVVNEKSNLLSLHDLNLPWNRKLFKRIRDYSSSRTNEIDDKTDSEDIELNLSAILISHLLIDEIPIYKIEKMNKITAIGYSQAVISNLISDNLNNEFIKQISVFLENVHSILVKSLKAKRSQIKITNYIDFIIKLLWINRFYELSKTKILIDKKMNKNLLDKLILHYKWIEKYFLQLLSINSEDDDHDDANKQFKNSLKIMNNYIINNTPPLNVMKKMYFKKFINFLPLYTNEQIKLYELKDKFDKLFTIIATYGNISKAVMVKKINFVFSENSQIVKEKLLKILENENSCYIRNICNLPIDSQLNITTNDNVLKSKINDIQQMVESNENSMVDTIDNFNEIENVLEEFENSLNTRIEDVTEYLNVDVNNGQVSKSSLPNSLVMNMIPFHEYYVVKSLIAIHNVTNESEWNNEFDNLKLNTIYFENINTLNCETMGIVKIVNTKEYKNFQKLWNYIAKHVRASVFDSSEHYKFEDLLDNISITYYKNLSTYNRVIYNSLQKYRLRNLSLHSDLYMEIMNKQINEFNADIDYNGSPLINSLTSLLFQYNGKLRDISLSDLNLWKMTIKRVQDIIWNNCHMINEQFLNGKFDLKSSIILSSKLSLEVKYVLQELNFEPYQDVFKKLIEKMSIANYNAMETLLHTKEMSLNLDNWKITYTSSILYTLIGSIELCLLSYSPIVDPVEKNHLKNNYVNEDIECLNRFKLIYDIMKTVMNYKNFGCEITREIYEKIESLEKRKTKFQQKVALRPASEMIEQNSFNNLMQEIQHFCNTNCDPNTLLMFIENFEKYEKYGRREIANEIINSYEWENILTKMNDTIRKINLWISNSQKFLDFTLQRYKIYYNDFVKPIECAIVMLQYGFEGIKKSLIQLKNSYYCVDNEHFKNFHNNNKLCSVIENIGKFPNVNELNIFSNISQKDDILKNKSSIFTVLNRIDGCENLYIQLLKTKLIEIKNHLKLSNELNLKIFNEFDLVLNICNKIWQDEEDKRKKRIAEEESLYTHKTRCETQNEDEIELNEIQNNFPTFVQNDFGEFIIEDTLEKVVKIDANKYNSKYINNLIRDEDYTFFGETFIHIMENFSSCYYYQPKMQKSSQNNNLELVEVFKLKTNAFIKLFNQYKSCLNEDCIDGTMYNTFILAVGLHQQIITKDNISDKSSQSYNFYKDANVKEIISIANILDKLESRVQKQLELYPDHAVLNDIICIIKRIRNFSFTSPVVRFNTGFQLLRQKVSQWNDVAHKLNHMKDIEAEIAEYVQQWTKLELQFWRNCLSQSYEKVKSNAYKYWFFIYNLLHEFIHENEIDSSYTDFNVTEKKFEDENFIEDTPGNKSNNKCRIRTDDITKVLRQFIEASNYADFTIRMKLLKSFELYLHYIDLENNSPRETLISVLHNVRIYFEQFSNEIEETNRSIRIPIEKKLRDFVKIESYNKDLSYFSMKNNVAKIHRNLYKYLKEYENLLKEKITRIFQQKDNMNSEYTILNNDKGINLRHESKIKYYMIDSTHFIYSHKIKKEDNKLLEEINFDNKLEQQLTLLNRIPKLFSTSKNIVKKIITKTNYSNLICSLDSILKEQIETCDYLRKLEIDRTQIKSKQVTQAKQILSLKRKALSDLFKILSNIGINFKSGLMEATLKMMDDTTTVVINDFVNYEISPFDIRTMFIESKFKKKFYKNMQNLNENLNMYFGKCIFKLKLLQNVMLMPQSELGRPNIERIKGYAIDMYILVQNQRIMLSKSTKELHELRNLLIDINSLQMYAKNSNFEENTTNFSTADLKLQNLKERFYKIRYVLEQFKLLLENVPEEHNLEDNCVFIRMNYEMKFSKTNEKISLIIEELDNILNIVQNLSGELIKLNNEAFFDLNRISEFEQIEIDIVSKIKKIQNEFNLKNENYNLPIVKPLTELLQYLEDDICEKNHMQEKSIDIEFENYENIDVELENIIHSILLSLQKLYKKWMNDTSCQVKISECDKGTMKNNEKCPIKENGKDKIDCVENDDDEDGDYEIYEKHLKEKITGELESDLKILNIENIYKKLQNILLTIKYGKKLNGKMSYVMKLLNVLPLLEQYCLIGDYYVFQQLGAHKITAKMLSIMLTVFIELGTKGFCIPPDLMQNQEEEEKEDNKNDQKNGEGFGLEDGTGENDASNKIESEDQLEDAKRPEDRQNDDKNSEENCKEEKGIEMSEDFDGKMQDIEKPDDENRDSEEDENEDEEDLDKEMGETEEGAEKLDDQIWGSDEENEKSEDENDMNEEEGKGSKEEDDQHNDLNTKNDDTKQGKNDKNEGLDATDDDKERKKQKNDIDNMQEPELDEEQINPYHNELEEPPEPEDMDLSNNFNIDEEQQDKDDENCDNENPFDIDVMKQNMDVNEEEKDNSEDEDFDDNQDENNENDTSDSELEPEAGTKTCDAENDENTPKEDEKDENNEERTDDKKLGDLETNENEKESEDNKMDDEKEYNDSKDNPTDDDKAQSIPQDEQKGSLDQVQTNDKMDIKQDENMTEQDTGEEKDGIGQAENDISEKGHKGIAESKPTQTDKSTQEEENIKEKRKQGQTEEQRTLGEAEKNQVKQLKTVDKLKEQKNEEEYNDDQEMKADEYQHVKEPKKTDKLTLDNATEEQSKQIRHLDDEENNHDEEENDENENQIESDEEAPEEEKDNEIENVASEKTEQKSEKPSKSEKTNEKCETTEQMEIEGDIIETAIVQRGDDTSAHYNKEILTDQSASTEPSALETLELRKMYQTQILLQKSILPHSEDHDTWHLISNKMLPNARELCEQLRLILEPTKCTRLKGDYRTGRRINMKKIIPYIASQFRKDKIWLRRTKPAQRDYKITIAIDDSKSMHHNNSKTLTLEAISLVSQALTLLESGKLSIVSFGESPQIILNHTEQFDGPKLVKSLNFSQNQSRIAELLDFVRTINMEEGSSSSNGLFENLLLILSDGRNIYSEGEQKVKNAVKLSRLQRIFLVYIIIDNPENKHSILDIRVPQFSNDKKSITMRSYLDVFPFPYYVIVRDLGQLPLVLSEAMRQWFELVNSEQ